MRFQVRESQTIEQAGRSVLINRGDATFTTFPAEVGNPNYDSLLESQSLTDAEVQAMTPDVWHDMA